MKRSILIIILCLLLCSCGAEQSATTGTESTAMAEPSAAMTVEGVRTLHPGATEKAALLPQSNTMTDFRETDEADYFLYENLLYVRPLGTNRFYPLCSKPNCLHNSPDCNAWAGIAFGWWNGALYGVTMDAGMQLVQIAPDGSDHTVLANISAGNYCRFHDGTLYAFVLPDESLPLEQQRSRLVMTDLETLAQTEPFETALEGGARFALSDRFYGGKLYSTMEWPDEKLQQSSIWLTELDPAGGTVRRLVEHLGPWYCENDILYYFEPDTGFTEYHLKTGEAVSYAAPVSDGWYALYDAEYIYLVSQDQGDDLTHMLYLLSRDYRELDRIPLENGFMPAYISSAELFFTADGFLTKVMDKSQIGSGELELLPLN